MGAIEEKSGGNQSQEASSLRNHDCPHKRSTTIHSIGVDIFLVWTSCWTDLEIDWQSHSHTKTVIDSSCNYHMKVKVHTCLL